MMSAIDDAKQRGVEAAQAVLSAIYHRNGKGDPDRVKRAHRCLYTRPELVAAWQAGYDEMWATYLDAQERGAEEEVGR
jgi:hypothetical protein